MSISPILLEHSTNGTASGIPIPEQSEQNLLRVWGVLRRNAWLILGCAIATILAAWALVQRATPIYEASATVIIDQKQQASPFDDALRAISSQGDVLSTEMEVIRSRSLIEMVADSLSLRFALVSPRLVPRQAVFDAVLAPRDQPTGRFVLVRRANRRTFDVRDRDTDANLGIAEVGQPFSIHGGRFELAKEASRYSELRFEVRDFNKTVESLQSALSVRRVGRDAKVVRLVFQSADPVIAREVPNKLAGIFIRQRQGIQKTAARSTVGFLRNQIDTLGVQLSAAENALRAFREGAQVVNLEAEGSEQIKGLAQLQAERNALESERSALNTLLVDVAQASKNAPPGAPSPYRRLAAFPTLSRNPLVTGLVGALNTADEQRAVLLSRRTPRDPEMQVLDQRIAELERELSSVASTYAVGLGNQVTALNASLGSVGRQIERIPAKEVQFARLQRENRVLAEIYTLLQTRLKEAEITQAIEDPSVRIVDAALLPIRPFKPNKRQYLLLAAIVGIFIGLGLALIREVLDNTIHTREDIQSATGLAVLGVIPNFDLVRSAREGAQATIAFDRTARPLVSSRKMDPRDSSGPVAEAYRSLRTNITFSRPNQPPKVLLFTSAMPGDGKSTTASNFAIILAQQGLRVLMVDADLRRGILHTTFGVPREIGLSNVIIGAANIKDAITAAPLNETQQLDILTTGITPPNPAELLGAPAMHELMKELRRSYDAVIVDTPPLNLVTDAAVLCAFADAVVVVARANVTPRVALSHAAEQLLNVRAPVLGAILNDFNFKRDLRYATGYESYGYYSYYGYGEMPDEVTSKIWWRALLTRLTR